MSFFLLAYKCDPLSISNIVFPIYKQWFLRGMLNLKFLHMASRSKLNQTNLVRNISSNPAQSKHGSLISSRVKLRSLSRSEAFIIQTLLWSRESTTAFLWILLRTKNARSIAQPLNPVLADFEPPNEYKETGKASRYRTNTRVSFRKAESKVRSFRD